MSTLARFQRIHTNYVAKHKRTDQLREQVRQSWARACRFDGIAVDDNDIGQGLVVFSNGNPHRITYDATLATLRDHLSR
jgi:beta-lactamase superfamily II metal-dependent hydrolase